MAACTAVLMCAGAARGQSVTVSHGFVDGRLGNYQVPVLIAGDHGFTLSTLLNFRDNFTGPQRCNDDPAHCKPGSTLSLKLATNFAAGTATVDGVTYHYTSGVDSPGTAALDFSGSVTLPPIAPTAVVQTSFILQGAFNYTDSAHDVHVTLSGSGTAIVYLSSPAPPNWEGSWYVQRVVLQFPQNGPVTPAIDTDIGAVGGPGGTTFDSASGTVQVQGSGADIWGTADAFHFYATQSFDANGVIEPKFYGVGNTSPYAKGGLMLRGDLTPGSPHIILDVRPDGSIEFMQRSTDGGSTSFIAGGSTNFPVWLRLTRAQHVVTAESSTDGVTWQRIGSVASDCCGLTGLAVTSHNNSAIAAATLESPSFGLPAPWRDVEISDVGQQGYAWKHLNTFYVHGGGADIWGTRDTFNYVNQFAAGTTTAIVARALSLENTNPYAKAGVMMSSGSGTVVLDVRPTGDIEFMARTSSGGSMQYLGGATHAFPVWLKLDRNGTTVTGSISSDGSTWTDIESVSVDLGNTGGIGLAVTSHDTSRYTTASFDNVTVTQSSSTAPPPPPPPAAPEVVVYAGDVPSSSVHGVWAKTSDATSPGGIALTTPAGSPAQTANPLASPPDYVEVTFTAPANTPYTLWLRVKATGDSKYSDSLWAQFSDAQASGGPAYQTGTSSGLLVNLATDSTGSSLHNWGWVDGAYWLAQPATVTFTGSGTHTLRLQPREYGVAVDQIVLSPQRYFNAGAHCPTSCASAPGPVGNDSTVVPKP